MLLEKQMREEELRDGGSGGGGTDEDGNGDLPRGVRIVGAGFAGVSGSKLMKRGGVRSRCLHAGSERARWKREG
jgi:hypothetical protein